MKRSMFSVAVLAGVLAFLYVPIILVVAYGFVPNGISMSFFGSDGSFLGFTGKWYRYVFTGNQAVRALLLACYDVYASYLKNDGGAAGPFSFRFVNIFGKRATELDDPGFEERCDGGSSEEDAAADAVPETAADRAARLAEGFAVKGDIVDRRS